MTEIKNKTLNADSHEMVSQKVAEHKLKQLDQLLALQNSPTPDSGLSTYTGPWQKKQILHLAKRTMFSVQKEDMDFFLTKSLSEMVDLLLTAATDPPAPPLNQYTDTNGFVDGVPSGETWVNADWSDGTGEYYRGVSLNIWWHIQMFKQQRSIQEKMTLFFHNLLVTSISDVGRGRWAYVNNKTYRANALGNYRSLIEQTTLDPMMLRYLNGHYNTKYSPDENYARELQELFTLGVNAGYEESDVQEAAKVLTGFRTKSDNPPSDVYVYNQNNHKTGDKTFSSFYDNRVITGGLTETEARAELTALLNMIFERAEVARFICRELYRFFVYYKIDSTIENNVIIPLANTFRDNDYEIKPVLEQLFKSQHFYDVLANGGLIKSPVDFLVGAIKEFDLTLPPVTPIKQYYGVFNKLRSEAILQSQEILAPPNVAGWSAYYQSPAFHRIWITANTLRRRAQFTDQLLKSYGYDIYGFKMKIEVLKLTQKFTNPGDPNQLVQEAVDFLLREDLLTETKTFLKGFLLTGQTNDDYWTTAWNNYIADPNNTTKRDIVVSRLTGMYKYILNMPEYQLM
ncbi:MAG TPA: DUF1800 domain-containing protein [Saprospiraceae bacterium]|nr:DUF1800 domain-containing protein [Saprospiraceae bacterium]HQW54592.1 DUF1800 domain-containing protein [Saprospiraceae bacterium]